MYNKGKIELTEGESIEWEMSFTDKEGSPKDLSTGLFTVKIANSSGRKEVKETLSTVMGDITLGEVGTIHIFKKEPSLVAGEYKVELIADYGVTIDKPKHLYLTVYPKV